MRPVSAGPGASTSGAPRSQDTPSAVVTPLHFRADEKGTTTGQRAGSVVRVSTTAATARSVALGFASAPASTTRAASMAASSRSPTGSSPTRAISPSVIVPVLSRQRTSTRASVSTAANSWTRAWRRPSRTTPAAKATLVSRTSPSGTMATTPATVPAAASSQPSWARS